MPTFDSPRPIVATLDLQVANVYVVAEDRADTVVDISPTNAGNRDDVFAAERTRADYADGRLEVRTPRTWRRYSWSSDGGSTDVRIHCPAASDVAVTGAMIAVRATGRLGRVRVVTSVGTVQVERAAAVVLRTGGLGDLTVGRVDQDAELSTGSGAIIVASIGRAAEVKNANGDTRIGAVGGDAQIRNANGDILVERAGGAVTAKTGNGHIRLCRVVSGAVTAESGCGRIEVAIAAGVTAWLDLRTGYGQVRNDLVATTEPAAAESSAHVRARSAAGDIIITRAEPGAATPPGQLLVEPAHR